MKRFLLMLILLIGKNYAGQSQTIDTLCFPMPVIQKLLIDAKQKKYADSLAMVYRSDINILNMKINALEIKDSTNRQINATYMAMVNTMGEQRGILEGQINTLNKQLKKQRTATKLTAISGILLTAIVTGLFILK